jgi:hypothetical protein
MMQIFSSTVEPGIEFEPDEIIEQRAPSVWRRVTKADEQENGKGKKKREEIVMTLAAGILLRKRHDL